jgi:hypothetical protein
VIAGVMELAKNNLKFFEFSFADFGGFVHLLYEGLVYLSNYLMNWESMSKASGIRGGICVGLGYLAALKKFCFGKTGFGGKEVIIMIEFYDDW